MPSCGDLSSTGPTRGGSKGTLTYSRATNPKVDKGRSVVGFARRSCHDVWCRPRHVIDEGGAATVLDIHRSGGEGLVGFGLFDRPLGSRALEVGVSSWPGVSQGLRGASSGQSAEPAAVDFQALDMSAQGEHRVSVIGARSSKKEVWTMSTLLASDWPLQPPDWPGFRMFSPLPSVCKAWNPVRVPPRARHTPSSEGVFALTC